MKSAYSHLAILLAHFLQSNKKSNILEVFEYLHITGKSYYCYLRKGTEKAG